MYCKLYRNFVSWECSRQLRAARSSVAIETMTGQQPPRLNGHCTIMAAIVTGQSSLARWLVAKARVSDQRLGSASPIRAVHLGRDLDAV